MATRRNLPFPVGAVLLLIAEIMSFFSSIFQHLLSFLLEPDTFYPDIFLSIFIGLLFSAAIYIALAVIMLKRKSGVPLLVVLGICVLASLPNLLNTYQTFSYRLDYVIFFTALLCLVVMVLADMGVAFCGKLHKASTKIFKFTMILHLILSVLNRFINISENIDYLSPADILTSLFSLPLTVFFCIAYIYVGKWIGALYTITPERSAAYLLDTEKRNCKRF